MMAARAKKTLRTVANARTCGMGWARWTSWPTRSALRAIATPWARHQRIEFTLGVKLTIRDTGEADRV